MTDNPRQDKKGKKRKKMRKYRKIGYSFASVYGGAAVILLTFCVKLGMLPMIYLAALGIVLVLLGGLFVIMQRRKTWSVVADVLRVFLADGCIAACFFIDKADATVRQVAASGAETDELGVYVLAEDPATDLAGEAD